MHRMIIVLLLSVASCSYPSAAPVRALGVPSSMAAPVAPVLPDTSGYVLIWWQFHGIENAPRWREAEAEGRKSEILIRGAIGGNECSDFSDRLERTGNTLTLRVTLTRRSGLCIADGLEIAYVAAVRRLSAGEYRLRIINGQGSGEQAPEECLVLDRAVQVR
jgi:hypothetical protein